MSIHAEEQIEKTQVEMISVKELVKQFLRLPRERQEEAIVRMVENLSHRTFENIKSFVEKSKLSPELQKRLKDQSTQYFNAIRLSLEKLKSGELKEEVGYSKLFGYYSALCIAEWALYLDEESAKTNLDIAKDIYDKLAKAKKPPKGVEVPKKIFEEAGALEEGLMKPQEMKKKEYIVPKITFAYAEELLDKGDLRKAAVAFSKLVHKDAKKALEGLLSTAELAKINNPKLAKTILNVALENAKNVEKEGLLMEAWINAYKRKVTTELRNLELL